MPKRKKLPKIPDYTGVPKDENKLIVQKSNPLQSLSETELTLPEFKILDAYLARINSHNTNKRTVKLEKGELERTLGVSRILKDDLNKRLRHLFQVIEVKDDSKCKGFKLINLFEEAEAEQDDDGLWQITLTCTPSAREYVFNIDNIGYLRYRLKNIVNLTSRYSYILYLYLENNHFRKSWKISLEELKKILNCTAESYNKYKELNDKILKKCQQELHNKTDLRFSYQPTDKKGRSYTAIKFTVETITDRLQLEPNKAISAESEQSSLPSSENELSAYLAVCKNELSAEQIKLLLDLMSFIEEEQRLSYFQHIFTRLEYQASKSGKKIASPFAYLTQMIKNDYTQFSKEQKPQNASSQKTYGGAYDLEAYENTDPFANE